MNITPEFLKSIAKMPPRARKDIYARIGRVEWEKCAKDVFYWIDERQHPVLGAYVYTIDRQPVYRCRLCSELWPFYKRELHLKERHGKRDEAELVGQFEELPTIRPFPTDYLDEYLAPIIERWLKDQFVMVEKSRDMFCTWSMVTLYTWDTLFHVGRQNIFQSEDGPKTLELLERCRDIYRHQPKFLRDVEPAEFSRGASKYGHLRVDGLNSELLGFPQGPDQIRQYHPTGLFMDEAAYQDHAAEAFTSIKPAIQAGGRFTAVSSANPSWFQLVTEDREGEG